MTKKISDLLLDWYDQYGRKNLPWQHPQTAYTVWLSEVMLQQTQVRTVIPYFERFMGAFPTIYDLALAPQDSVMALWAGLGYYSRARNLHAAAKIIVEEHDGVFPSEVEQLQALPGIGRSTACAIASQAFNQPTAILDANVKRVLSRLYCESTLKNDKTLWALANKNMPTKRCADYTQAIMDFGALSCTAKSPNCDHCPLRQHCCAYQENRISEFPSKKRKKEKPTEIRQFYWIKSAKGIYLQKKPSEGIWGGLWTPLNSDCDNHSLLNQTFHTNDYTMTFHSEKKHSFSHYHLHMMIWHISLQCPSTVIMHPNTDWFSGEELESIGLPAPIQALIPLL